MVDSDTRHDCRLEWFRDGTTQVHVESSRKMASLTREVFQNIMMRTGTLLVIDRKETFISLARSRQQ